MKKTKFLPSWSSWASRENRQGNKEGQQKRETMEQYVCDVRARSGGWLPHPGWGMKEGFLEENLLKPKFLKAKMLNRACKTLHDLGHPFIFSLF